MTSRQSGDGVLRKILEAACEAESVAQQALTVLAARNDPYRLDTAAHHRNGRWLAEQLARFYGPTKLAHWRGLYYALIMAKIEIIKPDGQAFTNTEEDWIWLSEKAGKAARWLGYIPFDRIFDKRNNEPVIHRAEKIEPGAAVMDDLDDVEFPDDITPVPMATGFVARQAFSFACFGEKASLEEISLPWANEEQIDASVVGQVCSKVERLQQQLDCVKAELHGAISDIELPEVEVPQAEVDVDSLDDGRQAVIKFDTDWVSTTKILVARKRYLGGDGEEAA